MFASLFLNLRSILEKNSLEPPERLADEVFFYQNMYFLYAKIIRRRRKIVRKTANFFELLIPII